MSVKILNEELKRIHEIMGIKHNLIVESGGLGGTIAKFSDEYVQALISKLEFFKSNAGRQSNVTIAGKQFSQRDVTSAIQILKSGLDIPTKYDNASQSVKNLIKVTMSQDTELSNLAYLELIRHLKNTANLTEEQVMENIQNRMQQFVKSGRGDLTSPFDAFKKQFPNGWQDLLEVGETAFNRQYSDFSETGKSFRPIQSQYAQTKGQGRLLSDRELRQASQALREERPRLFNKDFLNAIRKSVNQVKTEIDELSKGYWDTLSNDPEMPKEDVEKLGNQYAVQIVRRLNILEAKENNAAVTALRNRDIPEVIVDVINTNKSEFFRLYRETWGERQSKEFLDELSETTKRLFDDLFSSFRRSESIRTEKFYKRFVKSVINAFNPRTKLGQFMMTDSFSAFDRQWQQMIKQSGAQKGNRFMYILTAAYLNSIGYIVGDTIKDALEFLLDISLFDWVNKLLPYDIGVEGEKPLYTIPRIDNEESIKLYEETGNRLILATLMSVLKDSKELINMFKESGSWREIPETSWLIFRRSLPFGLGTYSDSVDANLVKFIFNNSIMDLSDIVENLISFLLSSTDEAEVVAYQNTKDSFKEWYKSTYPDKEDNVSNYRMVDKDPNDIYFVVNMKGTTATDEYYQYDSANSKFKEYE